MAAFSELRELKRQERVLVNLASKISDQLNRLKVEELALMSKMRLEEEGKKEKPASVETEIKTKEESQEIEDFKALVDLSVPGPSHQHRDEEEMDEEEDEESDDLTSFLSELTKGSN